VAWILLDAFSHVCSENQEHIAENKDLNNLQFGQKSLCIVGAKEDTFSEEISAIEKNPNTL
jgi:hypothetical protein